VFDPLIFENRMLGVETKLIWDWKGFIMRKDGTLMKNCMRGWGCSLKDLQFSNE